MQRVAHALCLQSWFSSCDLAVIIVVTAVVIVFAIVRGFYTRCSCWCWWWWTTAFTVVCAAKFGDGLVLAVLVLVAPVVSVPIVTREKLLGLPQVPAQQRARLQRPASPYYVKRKVVDHRLMFAVCVYDCRRTNA